MSGIPGKIVLKSTTKISLTERFAGIRQNTTVYQQNAQQVKALRPSATMSNGTGFRGPLGSSSQESARDSNYTRERMRQETLASQRSSRQSQYLYQRPVVAAAMKLKQRSLRSRLGSPNPVSNGDVYSRLTLPVRARLGRMSNGDTSYLNGGGGGGGFPSRDTGFPSRNAGFPSRTGGFSGYRGRGRGRGGYRGRGSRGFSYGLRGRGGFRFRGGYRGGFRRGGGRMRGRGGFRGRGARPRVTREALDEQLDQYMAKSKGALDSELDAYMAATDD